MKKVQEKVAQSKVENHAEEIKQRFGKNKPETKVIEKMELYQRVRQGDLYFKAIPEVPKNAKHIKKPKAQLVVGSTMGSRHCVKLENMAHVRFFEENINPLCGPVIDCLSPTEIVHPEHGNIVLPPGTYRVTYQRQANPQNDLRRVQD